MPRSFWCGPRMSSIKPDSVTMSTIPVSPPTASAASYLAAGQYFIMRYRARCAEADRHLLRHPRVAGPAAVVGVRVDEAGPAQPPLLLAPGRDPHLPGAEESGGARPREGDHLGAGPPVADRVRHHGQGAQGAAGLDGRAVGAAPAGVGSAAADLLRRARLQSGTAGDPDGTRGTGAGDAAAGGGTGRRVSGR